MRTPGAQTISARATQTLSSFNLDLNGLTVDSVKVNGLKAEFTRSGNHELTITPPLPLLRGLPFQAKITYHLYPGDLKTTA
ncbi:hypothetical protein ACWEOE_18920 [Amycolatopsis sp. NPDC004368]